MSQEVHGHRILEQILAAGGSMALDDLRASTSAQFGEEATYFTCSARGMSFDELLGFLLQRSKIAIEGAAVRVFAENMCNDDEPHEH